MTKLGLPLCTHHNAHRAPACVHAYFVCGLCRYTNYLARELPKVELLLTCVALNKDALAASIQALWPEATVDDVLDIMHMKVCGGVWWSLRPCVTRSHVNAFCAQGMKSRDQSDVLASLGMSANDATRSHSTRPNIGAVTSNMMSSMTKQFEALRK